FMVCCPRLPMNFNERSELGKLRYAFTPSTVFTATWLGEQSSGAYAGGDLFPWSVMSFTPPAGYTGSLSSGYINPWWQPTISSMLDMQEANLFETEFHTPLGKTATLLVRQYTSSIQTFIGGPGDSGPTAAGL